MDFACTSLQIVGPLHSRLTDARTMEPAPATDVGAARRATRAASAHGTYQTGLFGEEVVCDRLERRGWRVLGHRCRTRWGELDIVVRRGDLIAFCEVKTAGRRRVSPRHLVDRRSQQRLRRAAVAWMAANAGDQRGVTRYRFDVFIVYRDDHGCIQHIDEILDAF